MGARSDDRARPRARTINPELRVIAVLNAADAQDQDNREALEVIREAEGVEALPCALVRRKAYRNAAAQRRGVLDMHPKDGKAIDEVTALLRAVYHVSH